MTDVGAAYPNLFLSPGRDKRVSSGHPWAYSNEVNMTAEARALAPGTPVALHRVDGKALGVGTFNPHALIAVRLFAARPEARLDAGLIADRLERALALRARLYDAPFYRLVHAEADGLPGLVADRFGDALVLQATTAGMDRLMPDVLAAAVAVLAPEVVVLRNDVAARRLEDLEAGVRVAKGTLAGPVEVDEAGLRFLADLEGGQKTGWYFDQRDNRAFMTRLAAGGRVLDVYCHTGAFAIAAAAAGAPSVLGIDSSDAALALARQSAALNGVADRIAFERGEAFEALEALGQKPERFRVVFADPPAFAKSRREVASALKGYRKITRLAAPLVEAGGFLFVASCSHNVELSAFVDEVARGLRRAGREGRILRVAGAGPDHPVHPHLPETAYLKAVALQLD